MYLLTSLDVGTSNLKIDIECITAHGKSFNHLDKGSHVFIHFNAFLTPKCPYNKILLR